jgi:transcriptional regulator with XRE-family HTH domain
LRKDQLKAMANRIKERREFLGYTQEQFAESIDLSVSSYTKIENAFQKPSLDTLIRVSEKLNITLDFIVFGDGEPPEATDREIINAILEFADAEKLTHARDVIGKIIKVKSQ